MIRMDGDYFRKTLVSPAQATKRVPT